MVIINILTKVGLSEFFLKINIKEAVSLTDHVWLPLELINMNYHKSKFVTDMLLEPEKNNTRATFKELELL